MSKENILLIQLVSNGDCLFVTTIARQLKTNNPDCHLTWVISKACRNMILNNPDIDVIEEVVIPDASQNEIIFNNVVAEAYQKKKAGIYSKVIVPQLLGSNFQYYDGLVCSSLFRSSGVEITVSPNPVLCLTSDEISKADLFAEKCGLYQFKNVILFECAPQSGQLNLTDDLILKYCNYLTKDSKTCVILSAPRPYSFSNQQIINGNELSIRETVAFTHHCNYLLGCSSGISWAATSNSARPLLTVQMLTYNTYVFNPLSLTYKKWGRDTKDLIELIDIDDLKFEKVFSDIFELGFENAREIHNEVVVPQFKLHRGIVHKLLANGNLGAVMHFIKVNLKENGFAFQMMKYILLAFILFPFQKVADLLKTGGGKNSVQ